MNIFLDENLPERIADSLAALEGKKSIFKVFHTGAYFGWGIKDVDLIKKLKSVNGILVTQDDRIRSNEAEIGLIKQEGVSVLIIGISASANFEKIYKFIFTHWENIKSQCQESDKAPFVAKILSDGKIKVY